MVENVVKKNGWFEKWIIGVFCLLPLFYGMYYEFCGAIGFVVLAIGISVYALQKKGLKLVISYGFVLALLFLAGYILSIFYAIDSGMAFLGIFKALWIPMFLIGINQLEEDKKKNVIMTIPSIAGIMCMIGFVAYFIPSLKEYLYVNERLGGTFQYPNTFALFCLVGIILLCDRKNMQKIDYLLALLLTGGIILSGSRIVFVLAAACFFVIIIKRKNWKLLTGMIIVAVVFLIVLLFTGNTENIGRITTFSLTDSTLVGRILYAKDALPLLLKHPFGMGYLGYYYMEDSIQTGVYSVMYIHNDLLQIGLDIGWIPMLCYLVIVICSLFSKQINCAKKLIIATIFLHSLLDFDMEYGALAIVLFLVLNEIRIYIPKKKKCVRACKVGSTPVVIFSFILGLLCLYMCIPMIAYYCENMQLAVSAYPGYTQAQLVLLSESQDAEDVEYMADAILKRNDFCALAYQAKATVAYCNDDYEEVIKWQREAIDRDYFNYEEYLNYAYMLYDGIVYGQEYDEEIVYQCYMELMNIPSLLEQARGRVSVMGKMIDDKVELEIDEELQAILDIVESAAK